MASTANDIINRSFRLLGVNGAGETPTAAEASDALVSLNAMLEQWTIDNLMLYAENESNYGLTSGTGEYSIGPTGAFVSTRPTAIIQAFVRDGSTDYQVEIVTSDLYNKIKSKATESTYPNYLYYNPEYSNGQIKLYPVPNKSGTFLYLITKQPFSSFLSLTNYVTLPPAYEKALAYSLAIELAPEYGINNLNPLVIEGARSAKASIKSLNLPEPLLSFDNDMPGMSHRNSFNINTGV